MPAPREPWPLFDPPLLAVMQAAREAMVTVDAQQLIVAMNPAAQRMFRCEATPLVGQALSALIPQGLRPAHDEHVRRFVASGAAEHSRCEGLSIQGLRSDGEVFPAEASISRIELRAGNQVHPLFVALIRDLSHERALQDEVASLSGRLHGLLELTPIAVWVCEDERITYANRAACVLAGVAVGSDLAGRRLAELLDPGSHAALQTQINAALRKQSNGAAVEGTVVRADGERREVEIRSSTLPGTAAAVHLLITDVTPRRLQQRHEHARRLELRRLSANLVDAREDERRHLARELHDELGQRLSALKLSLKRPGDTIAHAIAMVDEMVIAMRRIAANLRPLMLDDLGLDAAIETLARETAAQLGIEISVDLQCSRAALSEQTTIALYRMVQEALTNVGRHAQAGAARITLRCVKQEIVLSVRDDGIGFPDRSALHDGRFGLLGMRERVHMLGGSFNIDNPVGGGGRITVRLPLAAATP
ncbi:MAG: PAS domain S-box protein [Rubrivivax sp.]|nr:PAS domain S-box protein [Rubrivivax sp.]